MRPALVLASLLAAATVAGAMDPPPPGTRWKKLSIPGHGSVILLVPVEWVVGAVRDQPRDPTTIRLVPAAIGVTPFEIIVVVQERLATVSDLPSLRKHVEKARDFAGIDTPLLEIRGDVLAGYYTEAAGREHALFTNWRCVTSGSALLDELMVSFTILSHTSKTDPAARALELLKAMQHEPATPEEAAAAQAAAEADRKAIAELDRDPEHLLFSISLPDKSWALSMDLPSFRGERQEVAPDASQAMMMAADSKSHVIMSAYIEREKRRRTVEECRKFYGNRSKAVFAWKDVREEASDGMILVHYLVPEARRLRVNQKNINAYIYRDGTCIDIHISKVDYSQEDDRYFEAVLDAIRFVEKSGTQGGSAPRPETSGPHHPAVDDELGADDE